MANRLEQAANRQTGVAAISYGPRNHYYRAASALHFSLTACTIVLASNALLVSWPGEFSTQDVMVVTTQRIVATLAGIILGAWLGIVTRHIAYRHLSESMFGLALLVQLSAWLYWLGFDGRTYYTPLFWVLPALGAFASAVLTVWWWRCAISALRRQHALDQAVTPLNVLLCCTYCVIVALTLPFAGPLLHATCLALGFITLGMSAPWPRLGFCDGGAKRLRYWLPGSLVVATCVSSTVAARTLPLRVIRDTAHPIVHYETGRSVDLKVTSVQGAFDVFVAGRLRFSTLDHIRWAEALTRPALSRLVCPKSALVLSMGEGLIERELLRDNCISSITSVLRDSTILNAARRQPWWRALTHDAFRSPRVLVKEADPAYWIGNVSHQQLYDLIIVDLPDPEDFVHAKFYTRYFYRQLRQHMTEHGVLVAQATSALRSPDTFASIRATLEAAGLVTLPYRAALTTLGEWSFILSQRHAIPGVSRPEWLGESALGALETFAVAPDSKSSGKGQVSRLDEPAAMDAFLNEGGEHAQ